jgi:DNA-binding Lrp family transcriptional regulator
MPKAFVMVDVHPGQESGSQEEISKMPGVQFVHQVTGSHDLIAFLDADPYEELAVIVSKIRKLEGVRATDTELVLR